MVPRTTSIVPDPRLQEQLKLRTRIYRYFFYGWMFRDAFEGSDLERAAAVRHNVVVSRWLPTYMFRWLVGGLIVMMFEMLAERLYGDSLLSAVLTLMLIFVVLYQMITGICWAFLRPARQSRHK